MKCYIGDGVYVDQHPLGVVLTTEDGMRATNTIVLEPQVLVGVLQWMANNDPTARAYLESYAMSRSSEL